MQEGPLLNWNLGRGGGGVSEWERPATETGQRIRKSAARVSPGELMWPKASENTGQRALVLPCCCDTHGMSPMSQGLGSPVCGKAVLEHPSAPSQL